MQRCVVFCVLQVALGKSVTLLDIRLVTALVKGPFKIPVSEHYMSVCLSVLPAACRVRSSASLCVCVCVCMYSRAPVYACIIICLSVLLLFCQCVFMCVCVFVFACTRLSLHNNLYVCPSVILLLCVCVCICACIQAHTHTHQHNYQSCHHGFTYTSNVGLLHIWFQLSSFGGCSVNISQ